MRSKPTPTLFLGTMPLIALLSLGIGPCGNRPLGTLDAGPHDAQAANDAQSAKDATGLDVKGPFDGDVEPADATSAADVSGADTATVICFYQGKPFPLGTIFPATQDCNTCTCTANGIVCTEKVCTGTCSYLGWIGKVGESFTDPSGKTCDLCYCGTDGVTCKPNPCPAIDAGAPDAPPVVGVCQADQDCNDNPAVSSLWGKCLPDGSCSCAPSSVNPKTGRCLGPNPNPESTCSYESQIYKLGQTFIAADGCTVFQCMATQKVEVITPCTLPSGASCFFDSVYFYSRITSGSTVQDEVTVGSAGTASTYTYRRTRVSSAGLTTTTCSPSWPMCASSALLDVSDITALLHAPEIAKALATPPSYAMTFGRKDPGAGGTIFRFTRGDGTTFTVGPMCAGAPDCTEIPPSVMDLVKTLEALDNQQLQSAACAGL